MHIGQRLRLRFATWSRTSEGSLSQRIPWALAKRLGGAARDWEVQEVYAKPVAGGRDVVLRAQGPGRRRVAVKANAQVAVNARQFQALRAMHHAWPEGTVAPLFLGDDSTFFVLDWIEAPLMSARLGGHRRRDALFSAGAWLARLHAITGRGKGRDPRLFELSLPREPDARDDPEGRAVARLRARHADLATDAGPLVLLHGDFQAHNLFDLGDRILGFDRPFDRNGLAAFDLARGHIGTRLHRDLAADEGRPWGGTPQADRDALREGYGPEATPAPLAAFVEDLVLFRQWHHFRMRAGVKAVGLDRMQASRRRAQLLRRQMVERELLEAG